MKEEPILPAFPDEVYADLPPTLKRLCELAPGSNRKTDMYLSSDLGTLSALFPNVLFPHGSEWYSTHLYSFSTAPAGAGKSVVRMAARLSDQIEALLQEETESAHARWIVDSQAARENPVNPTAHSSAEPEPKERLLKVGANTTSTALITKLANNPDGVLLFSTEADALSRSNGHREHGDFSDLIRQAFHREYLQVVGSQ